MLKMLTQSLPSASHEGKSIKEGTGGEDDDDSDDEEDLLDFEGALPENWKKVGMDDTYDELKVALIYII